MNCNQSTVVLKTAGGQERRITEIPDLWHIAQYLSAKGRTEASAAVLEVWHQAHNLKDAIAEEGEAEIIHVLDPNDLHAVVNYDEDIDARGES
jgi:hypothetical protein